MPKLSSKPRIVIDLDHTICTPLDGDDQAASPDGKYINARPIESVIVKLRELHAQGHEIVIHTSRNMRTYDGDEALIRLHTLPLIIAWLDAHQVPYDEIVVAKPWCGFEGFYVDDRSIRPSEFASLSLDEIKALIDRERQ